jgi:hypothetical protein
MAFFFLTVGLIAGVIIGVALMYARPPVVLDHPARSALAADEERARQLVDR